MMALSRTIYGIWGDKINLNAFMTGSCLLCVVAYLLAALSPSPVLALAGCALTGFSVGIMWPGTFSLAAAEMPGGGTLMFAVFAIAGDLGCAGGPTLVGMVSAAHGNNLKSGLLLGTAFAVILLVCFFLIRKMKSKDATAQSAATLS